MWLLWKHLALWRRLLIAGQIQTAAGAEVKKHWHFFFFCGRGTTECGELERGKVVTGGEARVSSCTKSWEITTVQEERHSKCTRSHEIKI